MEQGAMGAGGIPDISTSSAAQSANRNEVNNRFSTGDFNYGTGAGSSGMFGVIGLVVVVGIYLIMANKK